MNSVAATAVAGLGVTCAAVAMTCLVEADGPRSIGRSAWQMLLCLACGLAGAAGLSRGLALPQLAVSGTVVCALAGATYSARRSQRVALLLAVVPLVLVLGLSAHGGSWIPFAAAAIAAAPFAIPAIWLPRPSAMAEATFCALAAATLGLFPAFLVIGIAIVGLSGLSRFRKLGVTPATLETLLAGITLAAVVLTLTFGT